MYFGAKFDDQDLLDVLEQTESTGLGEYSGIKAWEVKLMVALGDDLSKYSLRSTMERAIMIMGTVVPDLISSLELQRKWQNRK